MKRLFLFLLFLLLWTHAASADIETTANVRLRTGPDTTYRIITTVPKGTVLTDLDSVMYDAQERPWYWVAWEGQECWVCGDYAVFTAENEPGASPYDLLSESRWVSVSILGADGAEAYPENYGGSELWLFPDGTAHWQVFNGEGLLAQNPVGHWQRTDADTLSFYQAESLEQAEGGQHRSFRITEEGLSTAWDQERTVHFVAYDVLDRWLPLSRDSLLGDWVLYGGEAAGIRYSAEEKGINASLHFTEASNGNLHFASRWNSTEETGLACYTVNTASDLITGWAPWYLRVDLHEDAYACIFMPYATMLRVEKHETLDGVPFLSIQDYMRQE